MVLRAAGIGFASKDADIREFNALFQVIQEHESGSKKNLEEHHRQRLLFLRVANLERRTALYYSGKVYSKPIPSLPIFNMHVILLSIYCGRLYGKFSEG